MFLQREGWERGDWTGRREEQVPRPHKLIPGACIIPELAPKFCRHQWLCDFVNAVVPTYRMISVAAFLKTSF